MVRVVLLMACLLASMGMRVQFPAEQQDDLKLHADCKYCGMHRDRFAHSRMLLHYKGGETVGMCSIHCAAIEYISRPDDSPVLIEVGDYRMRRLIDAQAAWWVIGGGKPGVMTNRAKWAFEARRDALEYTREFGGRIADPDHPQQVTLYNPSISMALSFAQLTCWVKLRLSSPSSMTTRIG